MGEESGYSVTLPAFRLGKYPITNREYAAFLGPHPGPGCAAQAGLVQPSTPRRPPGPPRGQRQLGGSLRLLRLALRRDRTHLSSAHGGRVGKGRPWGVDGRPFPWGDAWAGGRANVESDDTTPVTAHEAGASPFGPGGGHAGQRPRMDPHPLGARSEHIRFFRATARTMAGTTPPTGSAHPPRPSAASATTPPTYDPPHGATHPRTVASAGGAFGWLWRFNDHKRHKEAQRRRKKFLCSLCSLW